MCMTGSGHTSNSYHQWFNGGAKFDANRVNTFYVSSRDFIFEGTASDEGNVGHALYEFDTGGTVNFRYGAATDIRAFCAKPMHLPCAKFN